MKNICVFSNSNDHLGPQVSFTVKGALNLIKLKEKKSKCENGFYCEETQHCGFQFYE